MLNLVRKIFFINYLCVIEIFREKRVLFLRKIWKPLRKKLNNSEKNGENGATGLKICGSRI